MKRKSIIILITLISVFTLNGCAGSDAMNKQISEMQDKISDQVDEMQNDVSEKADQQLSKDTEVPTAEPEKDSNLPAIQDTNSEREKALTDQLEQNEANENQTASNTTDEPFVEKYDNDIVVCAKMILERFISNYKIPLAPQLWTIADFDENGAVIAITNITEKSTELSQQVIVVLTPTMDNDEMTGGTPHYVSVGETVYGNDGYCDDFISNIESFLSTQ